MLNHEILLRTFREYVLWELFYKSVGFRETACVSLYIRKRPKLFSKLRKIYFGFISICSRAVLLALYNRNKTSRVTASFMWGTTTCS